MTTSDTSHVYVAEEANGRVGIIKVQTATVGPKRVGLMVRHLVFRCAQQIDRSSADFTRDAALHRRAETLADELAQIKGRQAEIERALLLIGALRNEPAT